MRMITGFLEYVDEGYWVIYGDTDEPLDFETWESVYRRLDQLATELGQYREEVRFIEADGFDNDSF